MKRILITATAVTASMIALVVIVVLLVHSRKIAQVQEHERLMTERARADLKNVKADDQRHDPGLLAIYNPTDWQLFNYSENTVVEYYTLKDQRRQFLCKAEVENPTLKPRTFNDLPLDLGKAWPRISGLQGGTLFVQKVTLSFVAASMAGETFKLDPAFELVNEREFRVNEGERVYTEEVMDPTDPFNVLQSGNVRQLSIHAFAVAVKTKYPAYADLDDDVLTRAVVRKYPEYKARIANVGHAIDKYNTAHHAR